MPEQALELAGEQVPVPPKPREDAKRLFAKLAEKFGLDPLVTEHLTAVEGLESLEDFGNFLTTPDQAEARVIDKVKALDKRGLQASRLRQAWEACREAKGAGDLRKKRGADETDLDGLLPDAELSELRDGFHRRYKLSFAAAVEPSDLLVSRVFKELSRRMLQIHDVYKTRTLVHGFMASRKKQKLGEGFEVLLPEQEEDQDPKRNVGTYLSLLFSLMVAYARAGCRPLQGARPQEDRGSDSTEFVEVPLDVVLRYHSRAQLRAAQLPAFMAHEWVRERDVAERTLWVEMHRASTRPLGQIIKEVYDRREAQWDLPAQVPRKEAPPPPPLGGGKGDGKRSGGAPKDKAAQVGKPGDLAPTLKDGKEICYKWNKGACSAKGCPRLHVCNKILKSGRVCGFRNHTSMVCKGH